MTRTASTRYCRLCGSRLASDHAGAMCSPCESSWNVSLGPPDVPDSFWSTDVMRDALATWHIGKVLVAYRTHPFHTEPISQTTVAGWVGKTQPAISRLEGGQPVKDLDKLTFWARTLRIPPHLLWFDLRPEHTPEPSAPTGGVAPSSDMSLQETYHGDRTSALALAETAATTSAGSLTPLVETTLGTRLARAHAGLGNATECRRALEQARKAFARSGHDDEPVWVPYVDEIEVEAQEGACYLDLAMTTEAASSLRRAVALLEEHAPHRIRDRVHYLARLAKCHLAEHEVEQACAIATRALGLSRAIGSARVVERLGEFNEALAPYDSSNARQFRQGFAAAVAAA